MHINEYIYNRFGNKSKKINSIVVGIFMTIIFCFINGISVKGINLSKSIRCESHKIGKKSNNEEMYEAMDKNKYSILVDLNDCRLYLIDRENGKAIKSYPVAGGKTSTPSPIGTWKIIDKTTNWGAGFGSRWMQLGVPWGKYGIHGTNKPLSVGGPASLGCIRMLNKDVEDLYKLVNIGTIVVIYGGPYDMFTYEFRDLIPGDRGADVYEVQRKLKNRGYYNGEIDGIYGEGMKAQIIKFRKDNRLHITHNIDREFYNALEIRAFE